MVDFGDDNRKKIVLTHVIPLPSSSLLIPLHSQHLLLWLTLPPPFRVVLVGVMPVPLLHPML